MSNDDQTPRERIRRPHPERSEPIRSFTALLGTGGEAGGRRSGQPTNGANATSAGGIGSALSRSVEVGYRVVDEYVRQGQRAAERIRRGEYDTQASIADLQDVALRVARSSSELMEAWMMLVAGATGEAGGLYGGAQAGSTRPTPPPEAPEAPLRSAPAAWADDACVRLAVQSARPVEVSLDLRPGATKRPLRVHRLRAADSKAGGIEDVRFSPASGTRPGTLEIRVCADQPPGTYHGLVLDEEENRPVGSVSVVIEPLDERKDAT